MSSSLDAAMADAAESDAAEFPLEEGAAQWFERAPQQLPQDQRVKHRFLHVRLAAAWLTHYLHIDVNVGLQVSVNGGAWHGHAAFYVDGEGCNCWRLTFNWQSYEDHMKTAVYTQIGNTDTFLHIGIHLSNQFNSMIIVKHG